MSRKTAPSRLSSTTLPSPTGSQLAFAFNPPLSTLPQLWTPDDIFNSLDNSIVRVFKEDSRIERKRARVSQRDLADYVSMWGNTHPHGGLVLIGVENDGTISGCRNIESEHINQIETVRRLCSDARHEFKRIAVINDKGQADFVIALRVYYREDKLVETTDGNAFVREGDEKRKLTEHEKREIRLNKGELDVESERTTLEFPNDYDNTLLNAYRDQYIVKRNLQSRFSLVSVR